MAETDGECNWTIHYEGSVLTRAHTPADQDVLEVDICVRKLRLVRFVDEDGVRLGDGEFPADTVLHCHMEFPFFGCEPCLRDWLTNILSSRSVPAELQREAADRILSYASQTYSPQETPSVIGVKVDMELVATEVHILLDFAEDTDWDRDNLDLNGTLGFDFDDATVNNSSAATRESVEKLREQCSFFCTIEVQNLSLGDCSICLDDVCSGGDSRKLIKMPCSHIFHESCLVRWLEMNNTCPLCRFIIK